MQGEMFRMFILPALVIVICVFAVAALFYYTKDSPDYLPANAPTTLFVPRNVTSSQQKAAAAAIAVLKCPEAYANDDERTQAYLDFTNDYFTEYPSKHGNYDFIAGRIDFLISHNCTATLIKFGYDGTSPIDAKVRAELINSALQADQATSTL